MTHTEDTKTFTCCTKTSAHEDASWITLHSKRKGFSPRHFRVVTFPELHCVLLRWQRKRRSRRQIRKHSEKRFLQRWKWLVLFSVSSCGHCLYCDMSHLLFFRFLTLLNLSNMCHVNHVNVKLQSDWWTEATHLWCVNCPTDQQHGYFELFSTPSDDHFFCTWRLWRSGA